MSEVTALNDTLLLRIANWQPAVAGWPEDIDEESLARYEPVIQEIESLEGITVRRSNDWQYGSTSFDICLYSDRPTTEYGSWDLSVCFSRFAPIAIYSGQPDVGSSQELKHVYRIPSPDWRPVEMKLRKSMHDHGIYLPTLDELLRPINFDLPQIFKENANCGTSINFEILFNDLY